MKKHKNSLNEELEIWMESIEVEIEGQKIRGLMFHIGSSDIHVAIQSPFEGFNKSLHMPHFARGLHPEGFNSEYGTMRGQELLQELYVDHKVYAVSI